MFRAAGLSVQMQHDGVEISWPRVSVGCEFVRPVRFEDELSLRVLIVKLGEKSLNIEVEFTKDGERVALGKSTSVCCEVGKGAMRSIPIPPAIRGKLAGIAT
jgi:acyl-CoA thioesterase FadM